VVECLEASKGVKCHFHKNVKYVMYLWLSLLSNRRLWVGWLRCGMI